MERFETQRHREGGNVKMEAETGVIYLPTKEHCV